MNQNWLLENNSLSWQKYLKFNHELEQSSFVTLRVLKNVASNLDIIFLEENATIYSVS